MKYEPLLHVVLHQPEIPQNAGNIARTCVAIGAKLWMVRPLGFRTDEPAVRRAGLDYWKHLEWAVVADWEALLASLPEKRFWYYSKSAARPYTDVRYTPGDALVFGGETQGLPRSWIEAKADRALRVPIRRQVRSLNLGNTVAVVAYEALRQWHDL